MSAGPVRTDAALLEALRSADTDVWEWDLDTDALSPSDRGFERLGFGPDEHRQVQAAWTALIHPDDRAAYEADCDQHLVGASPVYESRYRIRARDGSWRWFEERGRIAERHPDGRPRRMRGTQTDITAQVALRAEADAATARMEALARHVPGVLFQFRRASDGSPSLPYLSERSAMLVGVSPSEAQADVSRLLRRVDRDQRDMLLASIETSARTLLPWHLQFCIWRDGQQRCLRGSATPRREAEGAVVWHGYVEDVTELLALERAQRDKVAAEAASRSKTEFLSHMSHELRTPLNALLGFTQLMEVDTQDPPTPGQARKLQLMRESGAHLLQMIGDLLDLTRIETGSLTLQLEAVDPLALATEVAALLQAAADGAGVSLIPAAGPGGDRVRADRARLRQVLLNVVGNAIKYNRRGGCVAVTVAPVAGDAVCITVQDDGPGIPPADLLRVFEPFYRGAQAMGPVEGSGIGLSVTRALVTAMDGEIGVRSALGQGSAFEITLPRTS